MFVIFSAGMLSHSDSNKHGDSPLSQILSAPAFFEAPPPLPAIQEAFEQEIALQTPVLRRAAEVARSLSVFEPEARARRFDEVVDRELRGPVLEAKIVATVIVHPVHGATKDSYRTMEGSLAEFVEEIPAYSISGKDNQTELHGQAHTLSLFSPQSRDNEYAPSIRHRVESGLEYLIALIERSEILSGERSSDYRHFLPSNLRSSFEKLLMRTTVFEGASFSSLTPEQWLMSLLPSPNEEGNNALVNPHRQLTSELQTATLNFIADYMESLVYLRESLDTCQNALRIAVELGHLSTSHYLGRKLAVTKDALIQFEFSAFQQSATVSDLRQISDAAVRFFGALEGLRRDLKDELLAQRHLEVEKGSSI